jgi:hypothetical protein
VFGCGRVHVGAQVQQLRDQIQVSLRDGCLGGG